MTAPVCEQLAEELRAIRGRSGLSLAALASRTPYSKSSWERYLNGRTPAPRQAVAALCEVTGEPSGRLLALWELADAEWSGRARPAPVPTPAASPGDGQDTAARTGGRRWKVAVTVLVAGAAAAGLGGLLPSLLPGKPESGGPGGVQEPLVRNPGCRGDACEGHNALAMGCGGAGMITTLATHTAADGRRLELRHAELCHALWVRATGLTRGDRVELTLPTGRVQRVAAEGSGAPGGYLATPMAAGDSGTGARICLDRPDSLPECFAG
ncbi:helix-turn-helix domain-containing protein [Streptomyces sp. NBC_01012]|uniref:helix-turn-helix domain-containing protein n=1 Tax=Streptomyces sp. NBC_01012 TaxID=2903717 RepID=UPI003867E460|nr:XRE family transcriptional regulator [Streptomyces sp. NBC_01012]